MSEKKNVNEFENIETKNVKEGSTARKNIVQKGLLAVAGVALFVAGYFCGKKKGAAKAATSETTESETASVLED